MTKPSLNWNEMIKALTGFRKEQGHCNVPAAWGKNPQLGRWVATQRYRRKIGELPEENVAQLDKLGFIWSASDSAWNALCEMLVAFKRRFGHCDVPTQWSENPHLANWVANQRHRKKKGTLSPLRVKRLDALGFVWSVYSRKKGRVAEARTEASLAEVRKAPAAAEERLYHVGINQYVQYNGAGRLPVPLDKYIAGHGGEYPAYIPLPRRPTEFRIGGDLLVPARRHQWPGAGPLPRDVIEFVNENGVLPHR